MSTDSLFKTNPTINQPSLLSFQTTIASNSPNNVIDSNSNTLFNKTPAPNANTSFAATTGTTSLLTTTTTTTTTTVTNKNNDISNIPPAFFVGIPEPELTTTLEHQVKETRSLSIGYGDRRLSGILTMEVMTFYVKSSLIDIILVTFQ